MAKKKQYDSALNITDQVTKSVVVSLIRKIHDSLCNLQQTTGYVPYYKASLSSFIWTDLRRRGRSTYGEYPTISFKTAAGKQIYIWWNRHVDNRMDVIASPIPTLEDLHEITEAFNDETVNWTDTLTVIFNVMPSLPLVQNE